MSFFAHPQKNKNTRPKMAGVFVWMLKTGWISRIQTSAFRIF